ncbi:MAG: hypothetical protein PWQ87_361 [Candidatus Woesearchaeota archaeon]|nr:hypothetical protein [Candidatus Woesearchaeota archaeon]
MEIRFFYSKVYFRNLNRYKSTKRTWDEVKEIGQKFEKRYRSEIEQIVEIIPKIVGRPWRREIIEVYIVDWPGPSFSHPLTLKVREDLVLMLVILTHELLHDFYFDERDSEKFEETINNYVREIFEKINIDADEQLKILKGFHEERFGKKE